MNILYTIHAYEPAYRVGGPVLTLKATAERLVGLGHRVTVIASNANLDQDLDVPVNQPVKVNGVTVWYFRRKSVLPPWLPAANRFSGPMGHVYTPDLRSHLPGLMETADLVHTQMPFTYATVKAARCAKRLGKPLFYSQHGVLDPERLSFRGLKKRPYLALVERPIMNSATGLIALTDWEESTYRRLKITRPCFIVPNGIDPEEYGIGPGGGIEQRWGVRPEHIVILFLARLHPLKGPGRLLRAFLPVASRHPNALLAIAGPDEWGMEEELRQMARQANLEGRVLFPGMVAGEEKKQWLRRADLFCLPSRSEGFSVAVLEAMASSTAVLLSPECHFEDAARYGAGKIAPHQSAAFEGALDEMLADRQGLKTMGTAGRALTVAHFSWDRIVARLENLYANALHPLRSAAESRGGRCVCW